jgi:arginine/lysine/ornithine decarboxylase
VLTITEAEEGKKRAVPLTESLGRVSAEFVYIYPPGIPIIAPGERISRENLTVIQDYIKKKLPVQGLADETLETIQIAEE